MNIVEITAATKDSEYEQCLQYHTGIAVLLPPAQTWKLGTKIKPQVILKHLHQADALLWVDADCKVDIPDIPPDDDFDVGIFDNIVDCHKNKISAAFILFRNTTKARVFLKRWQLNNKLHHKYHPALTQTIEQMQSTVRIKNISDWLKNRCIFNAYLPERGIIEG